MSEKLITEFFNVVDTTDWEKMSTLVCEDVVYERPGYAPIIGISAFLHFYKYVRIIASGEHQLDYIIIDEDHGSCWGRFNGYDKGHVSLDELFSDVYIFENDKIKWRRSYFFRPAI